MLQKLVFLWKTPCETLDQHLLIVKALHHFHLLSILGNIVVVFALANANDNDASYVVYSFFMFRVYFNSFFHFT